MSDNNPIILLDKNKIKKSVHAKSILIEVLEKINSTNDYLKNKVGDQNITVCIAEMQTQGRGRLGRVWHSPFGQNIYFSMRYAFQKDMSEISGLSLVVALAVCHAIESVTKISTLQIKWPNDVLANAEKIAGILIDVQAESNGFCEAIIGIGINVNMGSAHKKEINQAWSSLQKITGHYVDRNILCASLINTLIRYLDRFSTLGLRDFMNEWKTKDYLFKKTIRIASGSCEFSGTVSGLNAQGHLMLDMPDKTIRSFSSGDASVLRFK